MNTDIDFESEHYLYVKKRVTYSQKLLTKSKLTYTIENKEEYLNLSGLISKDSEQLSNRINLMSSIHNLRDMSNLYFRYSKYTMEIHTLTKVGDECNRDFAAISLGGRVTHKWNLRTNQKHRL
jgi:hypothetical protein